jgi:5'-phosphate synthase pdxT subunit
VAGSVIGVLALQGAVAEHIRALQRCGVVAVPIKDVAQLDDIDGLVLPGGESTTMAKLMHNGRFFDALAHRALPMMGTCAGLILLARRIVGQEAHPLMRLDIVVERNAYGRQVDSFETELRVDGVDRPVRGVFIRAPQITQVGAGVIVRAVHAQRPVVVQQGPVLGVTFHPELTDDRAVHEAFVALVHRAKEGHDD